MRVTESWASHATNVRTRKLVRDSQMSSDVDTVKNASRVRTRFVFKKGTDILIRDRINHESRMYEVNEVIKPHDARGKHHVIAICDAVAGGA